MMNRVTIVLLVTIILMCVLGLLIMPIKLDDKISSIVTNDSVNQVEFYPNKMIDSYNHIVIRDKKAVQELLVLFSGVRIVRDYMPPSMVKSPYDENYDLSFICPQMLEMKFINKNTLYIYYATLNSDGAPQEIHDERYYLVDPVPKEKVLQLFQSISQEN